jgi:hemoglobin
MPRSIFEKVGGFATVSRVVMSFYDRVLDSDILGPFFEDVDMPTLIDHQTKFVASMMGGPASYTDDQLRQIHEPLGIDDAAMDEMVDLFRETLEDFDFDAKDVATVVDELEARRGIVVVRR